ncbi:MAG: hypothetical protein N3A69_15770, partial [Leptospiraceae bacterium]|nr:hypothetical protein [Leptospiraceae bacterium]
YNIGTGEDYSIRELVKMISEVIEYEVDVEWDTTKPDGVKRKLLDNSKFCYIVFQILLYLN